MVIYAFKFKETNEIVYVGQTVNFTRRMTQYRCNAKNSRVRWAICCALRKYGWEAFEVLVLDVADNHNQLDELEIKYISEYTPKYNMTKGGSGVLPKGRKSPNKGEKYSEEKLARVRAAWATHNNQSNSGKPVKHLQTGKIYRCASDAAKELGLQTSKVCCVLRGVRVHTENQTFSWDLSAPVQPPVTNIVVIRAIKHNESGTVYPDMGAASRALNIPAPNIRKVLIGERPHAKGQTFSYID